MLLVSMFSSEFWDELFHSILWGLMSGILRIIDSIQSAFFFLVGSETIPITLEDGSIVESTLVDAIFGFSFNNFNNFNIDLNEPIHRAFFATLILFCIILGFSIVCSVIKINMNRQDKEVMPSTTKMLWKSFLSICIVLLMPIIFCTLLAMCGLIFNYFTSLLNIDLLGGKNGDGSSIAFCILKANISPDKIKEINEDTWDNIKVSMSFNDFKTYIGSENLNWVMLLLSECCILVGLGMCTLTVSERLINIVLLYLISPIIIATIPLDDGKRWENWKDITTSKITTAGANIISLYAFLYIITVFGDKILNGVSGDRGIMNVVYLFIAVGGSFVSAKGGTLMASIISANQGQQEGMSFMASQGMAKMGLRLAGGVAGAAFTATGTKKLALMIHNK